MFIGEKKRNKVVRQMKIGLITGASSGMGREFACQIGRKYTWLDEILVIARR